MKYDLTSDLHVDIGKCGVDWTTDKSPDSDILIIAGDVANNIELAKEELLRAAEVYDIVLFVDGNHEHYNNTGKRTVEDTVADLFKMFANHEKIMYLSPFNPVHIIGEVAFVGCCSWYDFKFIPASVTMTMAVATWISESNDKFCNFSDGGPTKLAREHAKIMADIVSELQDNDAIKKIVIVTHTVPHRDGLEWRNYDGEWNALNGAYGNSMMADVWAADTKKKIVHSVFGHVHATNDFYAADGIRFLSNPRGYVGYQEHAETWTVRQFDTADERGVIMSAFGEIE